MLHTYIYISFLSNAACSNFVEFFELEVQDITEQYEAHRGLPWLKGESVPTQFGGMDLVKHKGNDLRSLAKPIRKSTKAFHPNTDAPVSENLSALLNTETNHTSQTLAYHWHGRHGQAAAEKLRQLSRKPQALGEWWQDAGDNASPRSIFGFSPGN